MHPIIKESINGSISYRDYRELVEQLADEHSNTGIEKTEALANYTKLNDRRMRRWDKTIKISKETQQKISEFNQKMTLLIITESWCGDAAHVIPALNKMAELKIGIPGEDVIVKKIAKSFEEAITIAADSAERVIKRRKEKIRS